MNRRDYFAAAALQGLLAHGACGGLHGCDLGRFHDLAVDAVGYADAAIAELDKCKPSPTSEAAGDHPPAATPAAPTPAEKLPELDLGDTAGPVPESAQPPAPRTLSVQCEAPDCPLQGRPRTVEGVIDRVKQDVLVAVCDLHFDGVPASILLEWHHVFRKTRAQQNCREIVKLVDATTRAR